MYVKNVENMISADFQKLYKNMDRHHLHFCVMVYNQNLAAVQSFSTCMSYCEL